MRITGGARRGIRLATFRHRRIRPTTDRVREAVFNVLGQSLEGKTILDLFAGTGAMAVEALSRGAERAVCVDKSAEAIAIIRKNLTICDYLDKAELWRRDATVAVRELSERAERFDIIFIDAPYREPALLDRCLEAIARSGLLNGGGIVVCESSKHHQPHIPECLKTIKQRRYGDTVIYFIERKG